MAYTPSTVPLTDGGCSLLLFAVWPMEQAVACLPPQESDQDLRMARTIVNALARTGLPAIAVHSA